MKRYQKRVASYAVALVLLIVSLFGISRARSLASEDDVLSQPEISGQMGAVTPVSSFAVSFGTDSHSEYSFDFTSVSDGYVVAGSRDVNSNSKLGFAGLLTQIRLNGSLAWSKEYRVGFSPTQFVDVTKTADGGFLALGQVGVEREDPDGKYSNLLLKTNNAGDVEWAKVYDVYFREIVPSKSGGYLLVGVDGNKHVALTRIDQSGLVRWANAYDHLNPSVATYQVTDAIETKDGGFAVTGRVNPFGQSRSVPFLLKTSATGQPVWMEYLSFRFVNESYGRMFWGGAGSVRETNDKNYLIAGTHQTTYEKFEGFLALLDNTGKVLWMRRLIDQDNSGIVGAEPFGTKINIVRSVGDLGSQLVRLGSPDEVESVATFTTPVSLRSVNRVGNKLTAIGILPGETTGDVNSVFVQFGKPGECLIANKGAATITPVTPEVKTIPVIPQSITVLSKIKTVSVSDLELTIGPSCKN